MIGPTIMDSEPIITYKSIKNESSDVPSFDLLRDIRKACQHRRKVEGKMQSQEIDPYSSEQSDRQDTEPQGAQEYAKLSSFLDGSHGQSSVLTAKDENNHGNEIEAEGVISTAGEEENFCPEPKRRVPRSVNQAKKNRKVRTTITKEKLAEMNRIFGEYTKQKEEGKNPQFNLKEIGQQLQLGYSTILHKFREFRATKKVKGGALIASLQKKRKYRKSVEIEHIIQRALTERPFYTAVELSKYILCKFQRSFSRSIISRHLGEMGYSYKNLKSAPMEKNKQKYKEIRRMYAELLMPLVTDQTLSRSIVYVDEMACPLSNFVKRKGTSEFRRPECRESEEYVSVLVAARSQEILYFQVIPGFFNRCDFCHTLTQVRSKINEMNKYEGEQSKLVVITDLNKVHRDCPESQSQIVKQTLTQLNMRQYFLPPFSYQLNPLETVFLNAKTRVAKKEIRTLQDLSNEMTKYMQELQRENVDVHFKDIPEWLEKSLRQDNF